MNKFKQTKLLLLTGIVAPSLSFATYLNQDLEEASNFRQKDNCNQFVLNPRDDANYQKQMFLRENCGIALARLNRNMVLEIIKYILNDEMSENNQSRLIWNLKFGKCFLLKNSKTFQCLILEKNECLFIEDGRFLNERIQHLKLFSISSGLFKKIQAYIFNQKTEEQKTEKLEEHTIAKSILYTGGSALKKLTSGITSVISSSVSFVANHLGFGALIIGGIIGVELGKYYINSNEYLKMLELRYRFDLEVEKFYHPIKNLADKAGSGIEIGLGSGLAGWVGGLQGVGGSIATFFSKSSGVGASVGAFFSKLW